VFNSRLHGESFAKLSAALLKNRGPSLIVVREKVFPIFRAQAHVPSRMKIFFVQQKFSAKL
jgi:hypothetical protein